jgi:hypothetical protein
MSRSWHTTAVQNVFQLLAYTSYHGKLTTIVQLHRFNIVFVGEYISIHMLLICHNLLLIPDITRREQWQAYQLIQNATRDSTK